MRASVPWSGVKMITTGVLKGVGPMVLIVALLRASPKVATSGFLVEVKRVNLDELAKRYPDVFNKTFDKAAGQQFERILAGNKM